MLRSKTIKSGIAQIAGFEAIPRDRLQLEEFSSVEAAFLAVMNRYFEPRAIEVFLPLLRHNFPNYGDWEIVRELLLRLGNPEPFPTFRAKITDNDRPFVESMARSRRPSREVADSLYPSISELGRELDFLAGTCFLPNLTPIQAINLLLLRRIPPAKDVAVVVSVRDDGLSLLEWIAFYNAIGVSEIFVYTNDNDDGSEELLALLALAGSIRLIKNSISLGTDPLRKAYQHALYLLPELRKYRWVLFLDSDEFLVLDERYDYRMDRFIRHVENTFGNNLPGAVVFAWDWRLSDLSFGKTEGLLFDRYPHSISHRLVKSMTRLSAALGMCELHIPTLEKGATLVDSGLAPVDSGFVWGPEPKSKIGGSIAHFWGKSFEEFAIKKRRRELLGLTGDPFSREFSQYFEWTADLSADTFRPAPPVLLQRTRQALTELNAIPGVTGAIKRIRIRTEELSRKIELDCNLSAIFKELRPSIRPVLKPPST